MLGTGARGLKLGLLSAALMLLMAGAAVPEDYVLGPLDQVEMNVANFPDLTTKTRISPAGHVVLPLIGEIDIGGRTPAAAAAEIEARYRAGGFVNAPSVRLEITEYQSRKASVLGQVVTQGLVVLDRPYTVAELIARAGGLSADAGETARLVHQRASGGPETIVIDLAEIGGAGALALVQPGDVVFVPRAPTISVVGAVNHAGVYRMTPGMTVQQALATAGDVARIGTRGGIKVRRAAALGATSLVAVGLDDRLMPGDVVVVRERVF